MYRLQDISLAPTTGNMLTEELYYRCGNHIKPAYESDGLLTIKSGAYIDAFTYFNSLSIEKWGKYTFVSRFYIVLRIQGDFTVSLLGSFSTGDNVQKECLSRESYTCAEPEEIIISFPPNIRSTVVAFDIATNSDVSIYDAYYTADLECNPKDDIYLSLVTTTYKKEEYIRRNMEILERSLFSDPEYADRFEWHIVDNGQTLDAGKNGSISIYRNKNLGGAGGFARGVIESLRLGEKVSHVLFMDDDVMVSVDSFKRLYRFLSILRTEYKDYFLGGAMLNMESPHIQHANGSLFSEEGFCTPLHFSRDLRKQNQVVLNETIDDTIHNLYAAWWFCCIPTTVASLNNLPLPLFIRDDDMEYSLRNQSRIISLNGICIWHKGSGGKFNAAMDFYQAMRNNLIVKAIRPELADTKCFECIEDLFWNQLYKFDYTGATFLADALEDYLKGPEWLMKADLFSELEERRMVDDKPEKMPSSLLNRFKVNELYIHSKVGKIVRFLYNYTFNGQARIPEFLIPKREAFIPYEFGYYPENQIFSKVNYAISPVQGTYVVFKKDRKRFSTLRRRWNALKKDYLTRNDDVVRSYREYEKVFKSVEFWDEYLKR